jgi:hypothetical protein
VSDGEGGTSLVKSMTWEGSSSSEVDDLRGTGCCHGVKIGKNDTIQNLYVLNEVGLLIELITGGWKKVVFFDDLIIKKLTSGWHDDGL